MYTIDKIWKTGYSPSERYFKEGSEYAKVLKAATEEESKFWGELSPEGKKAYDEHTYKLSELNGIAECDAFVQGFRLGARLMLDAIGEYDTEMPQVCGFV